MKNRITVLLVVLMNALGASAFAGENLDVFTCYMGRATSPEAFMNLSDSELVIAQSQLNEKNEMEASLVLEVDGRVSYIGSAVGTASADNGKMDITVVVMDDKGGMSWGTQTGVGAGEGAGLVFATADINEQGENLSVFLMCGFPLK